MTVLTPVLYESLAEREGFSRLPDHLVDGVRDGGTGRNPREFDFMINEYGVDAFLRPVSLASAIEGRTGTLLIPTDDVRALLADAESDADVAPRQGASWWEFWRTDSDDWAIFPANHEPGLQVHVMLPLPTAMGFQFRTQTTGPVVTPAGVVTVEAPQVMPVAGCVHEAEHDEPGAPYRGRCRNEDCAGECSPRVVMMPDDGLYRLFGCTC